MPELPEVEVVRRGVARWVAGRQVINVVVHDPRSLRRYAEGPVHFVRQLTGAVLEAPQRRGKFLWIPLQGREQALVIHLGMSGQVLMQPAAAAEEKHLKITLQLAGTPDPPRDDDLGLQGIAAAQMGLAELGAPGAAGAGEQTPAGAPPEQMRFVDQRIFGGMQLSPLVAAEGALAHVSGTVPAAAAHIAPDPLEPVVTAETLFAALRRRRTGLKRALLDQGMLSGVGNIYADEALWAARLHYARRSETITRAAAARLLDAVQQVMAAALEAGGTSFDALYVNVSGDSGYFGRALNVYGQAGEACARCGTPIRRDKFMGRSSYYCPRCQPRPRNGRW